MGIVKSIAFHMKSHNRPQTRNSGKRQDDISFKTIMNKTFLQIFARFNQFSRNEDWLVQYLNHYKLSPSTSKLSQVSSIKTLKNDGKETLYIPLPQSQYKKLFYYVKLAVMP